MPIDGRHLVAAGAVILLLTGGGFVYQKVSEERARERAEADERARVEEAARRKAQATERVSQARDSLASAIDAHVQPNAADVAAYATAVREAVALDAASTQAAKACADGLEAMLAGRTDEARRALLQGAETGEDLVGRLGLGWLELPAAPGEAWKHFSLAAKAQPTSHSARYGRALADLGGDEPSRAVVVLRDATTWWPDRGEVVVSYARALQAVNDPEAVKWYHTAAGMGMRDADTIDRYVTVAVARNDLTLAAEIQGWIGAEPTRADLHLQLGRLQAAASETAHAEASFRRAIELDPAAVRPRLELASSLVPAKRYEDALSVLAPASQTGDARAQAAYGEALNGLKRYDETVALLESSKDPAGVGVYGKALLGLRRDDEAADAFKTACLKGNGGACEDGCYLVVPECCQQVPPDRRVGTYVEFMSRYGGRRVKVRR